MVHYRFRFRFRCFTFGSLSVSAESEKRGFGQSLFIPQSGLDSRGRKRPDSSVQFVVITSFFVRKLQTFQFFQFLSWKGSKRKIFEKYDGEVEKQKLSKQRGKHGISKSSNFMPDISNVCAHIRPFLYLNSQNLSIRGRKLLIRVFL